MALIGAALILWLPALSAVLFNTGLLAFVVVLLLLRKIPGISPLCFLLGGLLYAMWHSQQHLEQQIKTPQNINLTVHIKSLPRYSEHKVSFIGQDALHGSTYLFNWYQQDEPQLKLEPDQTYHIKARLKPPHGLVNGVGFDLEQWLFRHNISGTATINSIQAAAHSDWHFWGWLNQWRSQLSQQIDVAFETPKVSALVHALSIGDKSHFDQQQKTLFQRTGTAHLIAISGLHIGMVALTGWFFGALLFRLRPSERINKQLLQVIFGILFAAFYAGLAGLAISTQRALIMLVVFGAFKVMRRHAYAWDVWAMSLLVVIAFDPLHVLDPGFWLSFVAVAILIFTFSGVYKNLQPMIGFFKIQTVLLVGMLPLGFIIFQRINLLAPLTNFLMIPIMTFVLVPMLMVFLLLLQLSIPIPNIMTDVISFSANQFMVLLEWFDQFTWLSVSLHINHWWQYLWLTVGAFILILPAAVPGRLLGLVMVIAGLLPTDQGIKANHFKAHFLDVGQGLSVVVNTRNHTLVYDVGASYDSGFNMADAVLLPYLNKLSVDTVDALVLSHQDNDHSGAAEQLKKQIKIKQVWGTKNHHKACLRDNKWQWDGITFEFLSPYNLTPYLRNNSSCVLKISNSDHALLLTGDIESPVEFRLTENNFEAIKADVLLMPHHGSKTSSTAAFIQAVDPQWAINSSARFNPFGHPANEVLRRYLQEDIIIKDTQQHGLITISTFPKLKMQSYAAENPRIWRTKKPE
ncbi:DNA internalization-related competence protein ComEC/Rec2 [Marinicella sp. S1101]|uniref:DNA internalization-related competence protein ComEC/Rec2 n=1 Tax=Marinicella marina TaxID=2996016 RepID=UPI002260AD62|nr:DNA internalization-related competence protein ComEC/Rec2 [Marinicella marina]MCX7553675.1 DNA internalization-related competence protein ComEC/Rec2 [Marinicella marina]MDJ1140765.1 DNA internalization-related competence protein ComEC/Rec2 [Marinicella marina]